MKQEDLLLIERCKGGDQVAYTLLLRKYQNSVYNLCRKMVRNPEEARDLSQEAFVKTFATLDRYNPVYAFSSWLYKITANLCIDHIRKQRMKLLSIDEPVAVVARDADDLRHEGVDQPGASALIAGLRVGDQPALGLFG